jgi:hypothetical protein
MKKKKYIAITALFLMLLSTAEIVAQTRIRFARGRTSATVSGKLGALAEKDYVLGAIYGQYLSARVSSGGCVKFQTLESYQEYTTGNGDNWLQIMNTCRNRVSYSLTVSIR